MTGFFGHIREYLALGNDEEAGEPALAEVLSGFSCPKDIRMLSVFGKVCHGVGQQRMQQKTVPEQKCL